MLAWYCFQWIRSRSIRSWAPFLAQITLTFPLAVSVYYSSFEIQITSVYSKISILNLSSWWLCQLSTSCWYDKTLFMQLFVCVHVCRSLCMEPEYNLRSQMPCLLNRASHQCGACRCAILADQQAPKILSLQLPSPEITNMCHCALFLKN